MPKKERKKKKNNGKKKSQARSLFYLQGKRQTLDSTSWLMHVPSPLHSGWETCPSSPTPPHPKRIAAPREPAALTVTFQMQNLNLHGEGKKNGAGWFVCCFCSLDKTEPEVARLYGLVKIKQIDFFFPREEELPVAPLLSATGGVRVVRWHCCGAAAPHLKEYTSHRFWFFMQRSRQQGHFAPPISREVKILPINFHFPSKITSEVVTSIFPAARPYD